MNSEQQRIRKRMIAKKVGTICKKYREKAELSVRDVSNKTGYSTQLIYSFESGNTTNYVMLFDCYFNLLDDDSKLYNAIMVFLGQLGRVSYE